MKNHSKTSTQRLGVTALLLALAASAHAVAAAAVAFFVDVKAMLGTGLEAADGARHLHHITRLRKLHGACGGVAPGGLQLCGGGGACVIAGTACQRGHGGSRQDKAKIHHMLLE